MTEEVIYTRQITSEQLRQLIDVCHATGMFSNATWIVVEHIPDHVTETRQKRQQLLLFECYPLDPSFRQTQLDRPIEQYMSGRIFSEQFELRWEHQEQDVRVVYLGTKIYEVLLRDYGLAEKNEVLQNLDGVRPRSYFLFGQRLQPDDVRDIGDPVRHGDFAEARIPRILRYPVPYNQEKAKRREVERKREIELHGKSDKKPIREYVKLHVREFLDARGDVALFRFYGLTVEERQK